MTLWRFLAVLLFLVPIGTPFVYGAVSAQRAVHKEDLTPLQEWCAEYAAAVILVLGVVTMLAVIVGWFWLMHWLWAEVPR